MSDLERALDGDVADADDGHLFVDRDVLGVAAGRNHDRVARGGGVDRRLDGGVAAIADEEDVAGRGVVDHLDIGQRVGALGDRRVTCQPAWSSERHRIRVGDRGDAPRGQGPAVSRGIGAGAAVDGVGSAAAGKRVVASVPKQCVVAAKAGEVIRAAAPASSSCPSDPLKVTGVVPVANGAVVMLVALPVKVLAACDRGADWTPAKASASTSS